MAELPDVQERSRRVFEELLRADGRRAARPAPARDLAPRGAPSAAPARRFSVFDPEQVAEASAVALGLSVVAAAAPSRADGLDDALSHAARESDDEDPELVQHALSLFVTHSKDGRRLVKPRTTVAAPRKFAPSRLALPTTRPAPPARPAADLPGGSTGDEQQLDYWREDPLANEHHEHWHEVYPSSGLFPSDWLEWARHSGRDGLLELLERLDDSRDWREFLESAGPEAVRDAFLGAAQDLISRDPRGWRQYLRSLSPRAYATLFHLNDRHGELFFYMHAQMLARYDAERLSHGLERVAPLDDFTAAIGEGYDPGPALREFDGYREREAGRMLEDDAAGRLETWKQAILGAVRDSGLSGVDGPVPIDRTNIGENVEGCEARLRPGVRGETYPGTHNFGHGFISDLSEENDRGERVGVMATTRTAIRDPVFWRWHKYVDDLNFAWQETQPAQRVADFEADAAPVRVHDVVLCRTADLPSEDPDDFVEAGENVEVRDGTVVATTDELRTEMRQRELLIEPPEGDPRPAQRFEIDYLAHEPFCYLVRVESLADRDVEVTVRIFIAPDETAQDRRTWIEMDKFIHAVQAGQRVVIFRPDVLASVIKKPADVDPAHPVEPQPGADDDGGSYCECGWPYTLLLPRGTATGIAFRLLVLLTDAAADRVPHAGHCGSMSYCGAVDRYPDVRDMGYPFARPFAQPIEDTFVALENAAVRQFTIKRS